MNTILSPSGCKTTAFSDHLIELSKISIESDYYGAFDCHFNNMVKIIDKEQENGDLTLNESAILLLIIDTINNKM